MMRRVLFGSATARPAWAAVIGVLGVLPLTAIAALAAAWAWLNAEADRAGPLAEPALVELPSGSGLIAIANRLESAGVVRDALVFRVMVTLDGGARALQAGEYEISPGASMTDVYDQLRDGDVVLHSVTIPEGLTSAMIVRLLTENDLLTGEIDAIPAEGALLPETYRVVRGTSRQALLERMAAAHDAVLEELWPNRAADLPFDTIEEAVILASVVEKETGVAAERPEVASVFVNRLRRPMRLQSDPTIIYGLTQGEPLRNAAGERRGIRRSEIDDVNRTNPYNTYQIDGLPPGPICNPGRASLEAVLNPATTPYYYFVADGTGGHAFARTLNEHNANVDRWREIERGGR